MLWVCGMVFLMSRLPTRESTLIVANSYRCEVAADGEVAAARNATFASKRVERRRGYKSMLISMGFVTLLTDVSMPSEP